MSGTRVLERLERLESRGASHPNERVSVDRDELVVVVRNVSEPSVATKPSRAKR